MPRHAAVIFSAIFAYAAAFLSFDGLSSMLLRYAAMIFHAAMLICLPMLLTLLPALFC